MRILDAARRAIGIQTGTSVEAPGQRSAFKRPSRVFEATRSHPAVPNAPAVSPVGTIPFLREQQSLARHMLRNDSWIRSLHRTLKDIHIGTGPRPQSRFRELEELFALVSPQFDNRGKHSMGAFLREDVYGNDVIDGEAFVRRRLRIDRPALARNLVMPLQYQALTSAYVPVDHETFRDGGRRMQAGIATFLDRPIAYACYDEHPLANAYIGQPFEVPADEMSHVFESETGSPRGEVMLASAFLRAISISTLEDAERRRKQVAAIMSVFFKRSADDAESADGILPSAERVGEMLRVNLGTGTAHELPPGYEAQMIQPADEPENFAKALKFQLLGICASAGAPLHEVTGDWNDAPERAMRLAGASVKRRADIVRERMEHQFLNKVWKDFVDVAIVTGMWTPPAGVKPWQIYEVVWNWPVVQAAALTQELNVMMAAAEKGHIEHSAVGQMYFGKRGEEVARQGAKDYARLRENGFKVTEERWDPEATDTTRSIAGETAREEKRERDLVEEAEGDTSVVYTD